MLRRTVRWGKRWKCWKTIPTFARTAWRLEIWWSSVTPVTTISPLSWRSRRLIVRRKVDLAEPDGPKTTTVSPW
jgi:hypothetical protein